MLGTDLQPGGRYQLGMVLGVLTWLTVYIYIDKLLISSGRSLESKRLTTCAALRIPLQLTFFPDLFAGLAASATLEYIGVQYLLQYINGGIFDYFVLTAYFLTIFTGLYLSIICGIIYLILSTIDQIRGVITNA